MVEKKLEYAQCLEKANKWNEATEVYIQLLNDDSSSFIYERIAWCLSRAGKYSDAITYLEKLQEIEPHSAKWPYMIGYQYYCQKIWNKAIEWFEKSLEKFPDYFVVKYRLAYAYIQVAGEYKKLTKAEYWKALGHLRDCHRLWEKFDDQEKQKKRSVYFDINFLHGKILLQFPNYRNEAINCFLVALKINPSNEFAQYNLAKTYYLNSDFQKAKKIIPQSTQYYVVELNAHIDAKMGNYKEAILAITGLLSWRKKDYLFCFLAEIYLLDNNKDEAYKMAKKAVIQGPNNHKNYFTLARVYYQYGLLYKAIENLDTAIEIKNDKYNSSYQECDKLRKEILSIISQDYKDDVALLLRLDELVNDQSKFGTVCKYDPNKGFGFIKSTPRDIFFHISNCKYSNVSVGDQVRFNTIVTDKGIMAIDLCKN